MKTIQSFGSVWQDICFGLRLLARHPGVGAAAILTLATAIGLGSAIFSVVRAIVFQPLPFPGSERLMAVLSTSRKSGRAFTSAPGVYLDWKDRARSFESLAGAATSRAIVYGLLPTPHVMTITAASTDLLPVLSLRPVAGRLFEENESAVLLSERLWNRDLGRRPEAIGSKIEVGGRLFAVVGIIPHVPLGELENTDVWTPLEADRTHRTGGNVMCIGLLKKHIGRRAAEAEMTMLMSQIGREHREDSGTGVVVRPLRDWVVGEVRLPLILLGSAIGFVLLIGCANIANLMLALGASREREFGIRASIGASRFRLARQTMIETSVLTVIGGAIGMVLCILTLQLVPVLRPYMPRTQEIGIDWKLGLTAVGVTLACGIICGMAPAIQAGTRSVAGRWDNRVRDTLLTWQIALTIILLNTAALSLNSFARLVSLDLGFEPRGLLAISVQLPNKHYDDGRRVQFYRRLAETVAQIPGVKGVAMADVMPLQAVRSPYELSSGSVTLGALARHVSPGYFLTAGISILEGREFTSGDEERRPIPVVINRKAALALFGVQGPLGQFIRTEHADRSLLEVVGVAGDVRQLDLQSEPGVQLYLPLEYGGSHSVLARVDRNARDVGGSIRMAAALIDPGAPTPLVTVLSERYQRQIALPWFYVFLFGIVAILGLALSVVGIYGLTAYTVQQRNQEFGLRLAIGADYDSLLGMILRSNAKRISVGILIGVAGVAAAGRLMKALLYGVSPDDPVTAGVVIGLVTAVVLLTSWGAARRIRRIDPATIMRHQ